MSNVAAIVAPNHTDPMTIGTVTRRAVGPKDVRIAIRWAGICHSDIHTVRGDWGPREFPLTVGHEIVGTVVEVGDEVTRHSVGDRVGVGCMVNSCGTCVECEAGEEQHCLVGNVGTYGAVDHDGTITQGGYAREIVVIETFVVRVPESIPYEQAAPLLCAGITTYSPLKRWQAGPGKKVAVVGLGGLGHMAVKIAAAMGAEVTVLSQTLSKKDDGLRLGATHYYATSDPSTFTELENTFDLIINTVSAVIDFDELMTLVAVRGALVNLGAPGEDITMKIRSTGGRRILTSSMIGGIRETQEMLDFCAEHGIASDVEIISADQVNEAWKRVLRSDVRYRFVIDTETL